MTIVISLEEMQGNLSKLLRAVKDGKRVLVTDQNVPIASLAPVSLEGKRQFGALKGQFEVGKEFFDPLPEDELAAFE